MLMRGLLRMGAGCLGTNHVIRGLELSAPLPRSLSRGEEPETPLKEISGTQGEGQGKLLFIV